MSENQSARKQRRKVLTEEEYSESLSRVVQRNYFPDLPHLAETAALVDRRAAGDVAGAVAVRRAMRQRQDTEERELQEQAAAEQETNVLRSSPRPLHHESLTNFHARVTSEDNAEFAEQQAKEVDAIRKRQRLEYGKWALLTNGTATNDPVKALPPSTSHVASPLPLASDQFNATPHRKSIQQLAQEADKTQTNGLFFIPNASAGVTGLNELPLALLPATEMQNTSMPPPAKKGSQNQISSLSSLVEYIPKEIDAKKRIEPAATRFPSSAARALARYRGNVGLNLEESDTEGEATVDYLSNTDASTDLDAPPTFDLATEKRLGQRRKRNEMETLVQMTPVIVPGKSAAESDEPLMTWGEVSSTPLVLSGRADDDDESLGPSFDVVDSARDAAAERARQHMEQRSRLASATPPRKKSSKRPASIFGARPASARSAGSFGTALRSSYSGSAKRSGGGNSSIRYSGVRSAHVHRATPKIRPVSGQTLSSSTASTNASKDVTKMLLQLS